MNEASTPTIGALWQLACRAREAESLAALGFIVVNESRLLLDFRQSAIWLTGKGAVAVSGLPEPERDAPYTQWLDKLARALPVQEMPVLLDDQTLPAGFPSELREDWHDWWPAHALALPMFKDAGKKHFFAWWLLARDEAWTESDTSIALELSEVYAHAWRGFLPKADWRARWQHWLGDRKRKQKIALGIVVTLLFPVRLTVLAPADVTPKDAFPVRAPLEGAVDVVHVRPNQPVKLNQALFDLDTTGLRTRLSVAREAYAAASEEYRQAAQLAVSDDDKGRLEMNQRKGRMEEKAAELAYSEQLLDRVQVKAARDGVAVFTDASDWIGRAVVIGERVMQIADPSRAEISIRLPLADAIDFAPDAKVSLYLTNAPQFSYRGQLTYVAYKAEVMPDGIVAYKLKADFAFDESVPRLGLTGTAKIHGGWAPLVYYVLRRPLAAARQWIGW
jgi:hypothetical protein